MCPSSARGEPSRQAQALNGRPLSHIRNLFATLPPAEPERLIGIYRAEFVGPGWLRAIAPPGLALLGLPGWWGKDFGPATGGSAQPGGLPGGRRDAVNLIIRHGLRARALPMTLVAGPSLLDGRAGVGLRYGAGDRRECKAAPIPWRWVVDELRQLDAETLLGMSLLDMPRLPRTPLPFLLHPYRDE